MTQKIRLRFAPSPTGDLHLGSARTALYNWLYALHTEGDFLLRIEDTDRARSTDEFVQVILDGLTWLGMVAIEPPTYQTKRFDRYNEVIDILYDKGYLYRCYCSKERLDALRDEQLARKENPKYDGRCRDLKEESGGDYVYRFKMPQEGSITFHDVVRGEVTIQNEQLDDLIVRRPDGSPTYNFTVVVDDIDMEISHVVRGDDHLSNTPKQIHIYKALEAPIPTFAHMPIILGSDGKKLSKRHGASSVLEYKRQGILPEALTNYLLLLGWSSGNQEIFSHNEMVQAFDLKDINHSAATFNHEKLLWLNHHYLQELSDEALFPLFKDIAEEMGVTLPETFEWPPFFKAHKERAQTLVEMVNLSRFFFEDFEQYDEKALKHLKKDTIGLFQSIHETLESVVWSQEALGQMLKDKAKEFDLKFPKVAQPLRVAVTGSTASPSLDLTLYLLGREKVLMRIQVALEFMSNLDS